MIFLKSSLHADESVSGLHVNNELKKKNTNRFIRISQALRTLCYLTVSDQAPK